MTTKQAGSLHGVIDDPAAPGKMPQPMPLAEGPHVPLGYFCAISIATLAYLMVNAIGVLGDVGAGDRSLTERIMPFFAMMWLGAFFWLTAFLIAVPPVAFAWMLARRIRTGRVTYYIAAGALIGLVLTPVAVSLDTYFLSSWDSPVRTLLESWISAAPKLAFCGACGSLAFWRKAGRHLGPATPE